MGIVLSIPKPRSGHPVERVTPQAGWASDIIAHSNIVAHPSTAPCRLGKRSTESKSFRLIIGMVKDCLPEGDDSDAMTITPGLLQHAASQTGDFRPDLSSPRTFLTAAAMLETIRS